MAFPTHYRVIRTNNLPWHLFEQELRSHPSLIGWCFDTSTHSIHYPTLGSLEASHKQQGLLGPSSVYPSPLGFDSLTLDSESISDLFPDFGSSWVNASTNSMLVNPEIPASLTVLLRKATADHFDTSLESIYKIYIMQDTQIVSNTILNMNNHSIPTLYQLFSLFIYMTTNNLLRTHSVREIYEWANSNSCSWIFTEILKLKTTTIDVFATKLFPAAVQRGDRELVRYLVSRNVDVNTPVEDPWSGNHFRTALSLAVGQRNMHMIKLLCDLGATLKIMGVDCMANRARVASLWSHESIEILHLLLDHGADPDGFVSNYQRGYPLVQAASEGNLEAVSLLIAAKANVNLSISQECGTALQAAAACGHFHVVRTLLNAGADVNMVCGGGLASLSRDYTRFQTPIQLAAKANNTAITMLLLQTGALVNFCPILTAADLEWIDGEFSSREEYCEKYSRATDEILPFAFAIQYATQNENVQLVQHLLDADAMVDSRIGVDHGSTPLQLAARLGNVELVSLLLAHNADVNAPPGRHNGRTAIQAAAESGNIKVIQILLDANADVNASPGWRRGRTALQAALEQGHINAGRRLLLAGAHINAGPGYSKGLTALQAAVSFGDIDIVKELLGYYADINAAAGPEEGLTALQAAVKHKNIDLLQLLLQIYADVDALPSKLQNKTALQYAVYEEWKEGVQLLLNYNPNVCMLPPYEDDLYALSALGWAIESRNHDMIALLLDYGAGPNDPVMNSQDAPPTAFLYALNWLNSFESVELFVKKDPDIFQCWGAETALDIAIGVIYVNCEVVRMIIDMISQTTTGNHFDASFRNSLTSITVDDELPANIELLQLLLDAGADIDAKNVFDNCTILQKSARYGSAEVIEFLVQHAAEVNIPATKKTGTPLQEAIKHQGQTGIAYLLLEHGADVNALPAEERGVTALQAAAIHGYVPLALKLLERGADVTAAPAPINGRTAINGAAEHGHLDMLQLLLNAYGDREGLASVCNQAAYFAEKEGHVAIAKWLRAYATS